MNASLPPAVLAAFAALTISTAQAADELNVGPGVTYAEAPLALHGADPVALVETGETVLGDAALFAAHEGAAYYFASAENQAAFNADPARYTPQNGGFCTFGVSVGKKFDGNPQHFDVHDGKLYVFLNADTRAAYLEDVPGTIAKATEQWSRIETVPAGDL